MSDTLMEFLFKNSIIDTSVNKLIGSSVLIALAIAAVLYFLVLAYNYANSSIKSITNKSADSFFDIEEFARVLVLIACIVLYLPMVTAITETVEFFNKFSAIGTKEYEVMDKYAQNYVATGSLYYAEITENAWKQQLEDPNTTQAEKDVASKELQMIAERKEKTGQYAVSGTGSQDGEEGSFWNWLNPFQLSYVWLQGIIAAIALVVKVIIVAVTMNVWKVLAIVGPFAFAFSIIPAFKNQITIWFSTFLNTGFVFTTLNIIDGLNYSMFNYFIEKNGGDSYHGQGLLIMNATSLILYTMCFWLTSKYIGKSDAGGVVTKGVMVAAAAVGGAALGAGAAGSGGGNVATAANSAKDIFKQD